MCDDGPCFEDRDGKIFCIARLGQPQPVQRTPAGKSKAKKAIKCGLRPSDVLSLPLVALAAPLSPAALQRTVGHLLHLKHDIAWVKQLKQVRIYERVSLGEVRLVRIDQCCSFMRVGMLWNPVALLSH